MKLIIAEKPELGRAIAKGLDISAPEVKGTISNDEYTVIWGYGHLLELKQPQEYDEKYAKWNLADLPIYFENWELVPTQTKKSRLLQIKSLIGKADEIIHAGDMDDEGQYLVDEILDYCGNSKPVFRVLINDNTEKEIQKSFAKLEPNTGRFLSAGQSAYARSVCDLIVGVNYSRFFALTLNVKGLSVGRVQTPTLGLVVNRDNLIEKHIKQIYYELVTKCPMQEQEMILKFKPDKELLGDDKYIFDKNILVEISQNLSEQDLFLTVEKKKTATAPPLPFNLVKLQVHMSKKYNMPIGRTLEASQSLRDKYKAITYNRSTSQYLKEEHYISAPVVIANVLKKLKTTIPVDFTIKSKCFNDSNVSAHHGIIPTNSDFDIEQLSGDEKLVYIETANRYIMQFLPPIKKETTTAFIPLEHGRLEATATVILERGYETYFMNNESDEPIEPQENALVSIPTGMYPCSITDSHLTAKETAPPTRYTQASLITDMTQIAKYVDEPKIKALLKEKDKGDKGENGSIGTAATRSAIIETLLKRGYLIDDGKYIRSTLLGRELYDILPDEIKKADMTALWWVIQEDIKDLKATPADMAKSVLELFKKHLAADYSDKHITNDNKREIIGKCPACGKPIYENKASFGCSGYKDGCRFSIFKDNKFSRGKIITKTMAVSLLTKGQCNIPNIQKKDGSGTYDMILKVAVKNGVANYTTELANLKKN